MVENIYMKAKEILKRENMAINGKKEKNDKIKRCDVKI